MIYELTDDKISNLEKSFIDKKCVEKELKNNPFGKFLIMEENNIIIGYLYYSDIYDRAEINQFEIEKTCRNRGKGNELLKYFIEKVNKSISLEVREDNFQAIRLYEKYNFKKVSIRVGYYQGVNGILMIRKFEL